jgi:hypothetical protein
MRLLVRAAVLLLTAATAASLANAEGARIGRSEAESILLSWLESHPSYSTPGTCLSPKAIEYRNFGYRIDVVAAGCPGGSPDGPLGMWRVDGNTGEVYVRDAAGKYVRPRSADGKAAWPLIREKHEINVDEVRESWRLEWRKHPTPVCSPEQEDWRICPCWGFAFGEQGELDLVRVRGGEPEDRLHLSPLFEEAPGEGAVLRRWPLLTGDEDAAGKPGFATTVRSRPPVAVMNFADYDRDGRATEFVLQVGAGPCGHQQALLVGIDRRNSRLHAFGTAEHPDEPLTLEDPSDWENGGAEVAVVQYACGDHGSEQESEIRLKTDPRDPLQVRLSRHGRPSRRAPVAKGAVSRQARRGVFG